MNGWSLERRGERELAEREREREPACSSRACSVQLSSAADERMSPEQKRERKRERERDSRLTRSDVKEEHLTQLTHFHSSSTFAI